MCPQIPYCRYVAQTQFFEGDIDCRRRIAPIEERDGFFARSCSTQILGPSLHRAVSLGNGGLNAGGVLVDGDQFLIGNNRKGFFGNAVEIHTQHQRGGHHTPHREVGFVLLIGHSVSDLHHIQVIDVTGSVVLCQRFDAVDLIEYRIKGIGNVAAGTPGIGAIHYPFTGELPAADVVDLVLAGCILDFRDDLTDHRIAILKIQPQQTAAAPVYLDEIVFPFHQIAVQILAFIAQQTDVVVIILFITLATAGGCTCIGVDADLQAQCVDFVGQICHSRGEAVGIDVYQPVIASAVLPAVVYVDVGIAQIGKSQLYQLVSLRENRFFGDIGTVGVPGCPAHQRRFPGFFLLCRLRRICILRKGGKYRHKREHHSHRQRPRQKAEHYFESDFKTLFHITSPPKYMHSPML